MQLDHGRGRAALLAAAALLTVGIVAFVAHSITASDSRVTTDLLPNLRPAAPGALDGQTGPSPKGLAFYLGFASAAENVGAGPLVVLGRRPGAKQPQLGLRQEIGRSDGTIRSVPLAAKLRYVTSPDHAHWHLLGFMRYELRSADGATVLHDRKTGFCLGDRYRIDGALPGRSQTPRFSDECGKGAPGLMRIREGISPGWGDDYEPNLEGQEFDITSLPAGRYVLVHRVNPRRELRESSYADNVSSMALELSWPRGRKLPPSIDVIERCLGSATCP